jgi:hypothetical protein
MKDAQKLYTFLLENKATCYGKHRNDLGQVVEFYEHPIHGEDSDVLALFPNYGVAFSTGFFDTEDMTATYHSIGMFLDSKDEDMDYVPRFLNGELVFKFEE